MAYCQLVTNLSTSTARGCVASVWTLPVRSWPRAVAQRRPWWRGQTWTPPWWPRRTATPSSCGTTTTGAEEPWSHRTAPTRPSSRSAPVTEDPSWPELTHLTSPVTVSNCRPTTPHPPPAGPTPPRPSRPGRAPRWPPPPSPARARTRRCPASAPFLANIDPTVRHFSLSTLKRAKARNPLDSPSLVEETLPREILEYLSRPSSPRARLQMTGSWWRETRSCQSMVSLYTASATTRPSLCSRGSGLAQSASRWSGDQPRNFADPGNVTKYFHTSHTEIFFFSLSTPKSRSVEDILDTTSEEWNYKV